MKLATGPVTWGVDFADAPNNPPSDLVLDEIAASGLGALELGPIGYLPTDPPTLRAALDSRHLTAVGSFVFDDFHDERRREEVIAAVTRACRTIADSGGEVISLIDRPSSERTPTAGRSDAAPRLRGADWRVLMTGFEQAAAIARNHGLTPVVHPHAGGYVEFQDEVERLLEDSSLDLCLDTGHFAYAGMNAHEAIRSYAARISHIHLKDVDQRTLERVHTDMLDFWSAIDQGIFCPLGEGIVNLTAVVAALDDTGYTGYATIEQDRTPTSGSPLEELRRSIAAIHSAQMKAA